MSREIGHGSQKRECLVSNQSETSETYCIKIPLYVCMYGHTYSKSMDQQGKVTNPARGQLNRKNGIALSEFAPGNSVS